MKPHHPAETVESPSDAPLDDQIILRKIVERDETALATLYDRWMPQVFSLAMNIVQSSVDAEDVVEETFWIAWERAATYDPLFVSPLTWLLSIARGRALERLRARRRRRGESLETQAEKLRQDDRATVVNVSKAELALEVDGANERESMMSAIGSLPIDQQRIIELAYFSGFRQNEIAELLQIPVGTARVRSRVGMETLRDAVPALRGGVV